MPLVDLVAEQASTYLGEHLNDEVFRPGTMHIPRQFGLARLPDWAIVGERVRQHRSVHMITQHHR